MTETVPRRAEITENSAERKQTPVASGVLDYFPDALVAIAKVSWFGNEKHNPGQPLHWSRGTSDDHADCLIRHFLQRGTTDSSGVLHSAEMAWRALALLQLEIEASRELPELRSALATEMADQSHGNDLPTIVVEHHDHWVPWTAAHAERYPQGPTTEPNRSIDVLYRGGLSDRRTHVERYRWNHIGSDVDIVGWRHSEIAD